MQITIVQKDKPFKQGDETYVFQKLHKILQQLTNVDNYDFHCEAVYSFFVVRAIKEDCQMLIEEPDYLRYIPKYRWQIIGSNHPKSTEKEQIAFWLSTIIPKKIINDQYCTLEQHAQRLRIIDYFLRIAQVFRNPEDDPFAWERKNPSLTKIEYQIIKQEALTYIALFNLIKHGYNPLKQYFLEKENLHLDSPLNLFLNIVVDDAQRSFKKIFQKLYHFNKEKYVRELKLIKRSWRNTLTEKDKNEVEKIEIDNKDRLRKKVVDFFCQPEIRKSNSSLDSLCDEYLSSQDQLLTMAQNPTIYKSETWIDGQDYDGIIWRRNDLC